MHAGGGHGCVSENGWDDTVAAGKILGADTSAPAAPPPRASAAVLRT